MPERVCVRFGEEEWQIDGERAKYDSNKALTSEIPHSAREIDILNIGLEVTYLELESLKGCSLGEDSTHD